MKILIVDDKPRKYERLFPRLAELGIERDKDIDVVTSAHEAINRMESKSYDLLVLDILIPYRAEDEENISNSVQVLMEISDTEGLNSPSRIVGISADKKAAEEASPIFSSNLWTIIEYNETTDEWVSQLYSCAKYMISNEKNGNPPESKIDVAIICALLEPELSEILRLPWSFGAPEPIDDVTFGHKGQFRCNGGSYSVAAFGVGRMGMVPSALKAARVIHRLRPKLLIMAGICAGIQGKVSLGDVVLADPCWDWQSGKYVREQDASHFLGAAYQHNPPSVVRTHVEQLKSDRTALAGIAVGAPDQKLNLFKVVIGPMASGSAVIADADVTSEIRTQHRETCAIDMESYGIYGAAYQSDEPSPVTFVMKGVCDFADPYKNDGHQRDAAFASAQVIQLLLERYADRITKSAD